MKNTKSKGRLSIIGTGPGDRSDMTLRAWKALEESDTIVGYDTYIDLIKDYFPEKNIYSTNMRRERERCEYAIERAAEGNSTALISGGDSGIYGMAALVYEILAEEKYESYDNIDISVVPGITAAVSGGALSGAPLSNDFAVISLSDLLTPWDEIEHRLRALAASNLVTVIYNPGSKKRTGHLARACDIFLGERAADTVCAVTSNISRADESMELLTLAELRGRRVGMDSTVFIGNKYTKIIKDRMVTFRGYRSDRFSRAKRVLIFGGTSEGNELAALAAENGYNVTLSSASDYGVRAASEYQENRKHTEKHGNIHIVKGNISDLITDRFTCVISAVHPYASSADSEIRRLAEERGVRYIRAKREIYIDSDFYDNEGSAFSIQIYNNIDEIIDTLNDNEYINKRVFFAAGSRSAGSYMRLKNGKERAVIRCLPDERSVRMCMDAGFSGKNLICMQGPFSAELNQVMFKESGAEVLVTKLSGKTGGLDTKLQAARCLNMRVMAAEAADSAVRGHDDVCRSISYVKHMIMNGEL